MRSGSRPASLIDKGEFAACRATGIGRSCKVGKEQIAGLLAGLKPLRAEDDATRNERFARIGEFRVEALRRVPAAARTED